MATYKKFLNRSTATQAPGPGRSSRSACDAVCLSKEKLSPSFPP